MNIEILFRDGTKLKLVGYSMVDETSTSIVYRKSDGKESVIGYKENISYIHTKEE
jgi:hypothetical protein